MAMAQALCGGAFVHPSTLRVGPLRHQPGGGSQWCQYQVGWLVDGRLQQSCGDFDKISLHQIPDVHHSRSYQHYSIFKFARDRFTEVYHLIVFDMLTGQIYSISFHSARQVEHLRAWRSGSGQPAGSVLRDSRLRWAGPILKPGAPRGGPRGAHCGGGFLKISYWYTHIYIYIHIIIYNVHIMCI